MRNGVVLLIVGLLTASCVSTPESPTDSNTYERGGVFVLCEGLWQQNNGAISYVRSDGQVISDLTLSMSDRPLGDTPSDMVVLGDSIYVALNTAGRIGVIDKASGEWRGDVMIGLTRQPYRMAAAGGRLYVTNLNDDSMTELQASPLQTLTARLEVGPAPEGIAVVNNKIYIAISGLGDLFIV